MQRRLPLPMPHITLPPTIDQGWASELAGTANNKTADAPTGATSQGMDAGPTVTAQVRAASPTANDRADAGDQPVVETLAPAKMGLKQRHPCSNEFEPFLAHHKGFDLTSPMAIGSDPGLVGTQPLFRF